MAHRAAREPLAGRLVISETVVLLSVLGGTADDLEKVLILEDIFQERNKKDES